MGKHLSRSHLILLLTGDAIFLLAVTWLGFATHGRSLTGVRWLVTYRPQNLITGPIIYSMIFPLLILDVFVTVYQATCFPIYRVAKVSRGDYIVFDRQQLEYLNFIEKFHCTYCAYGAGLIAYVGEIVARTEQYFCPIKHARRILGEIDDMEQLLGVSKATPKGLLRVNATLGFGRSHVAPLISRFLRKYPQVEVQLQLSVNPPPLTDDAFDVCIRFGAPRGCRCGAAAGRPRGRVVRSRLCVRLSSQHLARQVVGQDRLPLADRDRVLEGVLELAHVAGPVVRHQVAHGLLRDAERGHIRDVLFKGIAARGEAPVVELTGFDAEHAVENVRFQDVPVHAA